MEDFFGFATATFVLGFFRFGLLVYDVLKTIICDTP